MKIEFNMLLFLLTGISTAGIIAILGTAIYKFFSLNWDELKIVLKVVGYFAGFLITMTLIGMIVISFVRKFDE